ncbi:hypothetical protein LTR36_004892 [Oleoguttula mirabilis]|uniref:RING-type domain-containing protein n=1 Tax=Oleoguttula mirabilis TaxID=1507867 RepID=A0AAV9JG57_9PEZI|nr:hypothetical protein LTR36_004892 [Oleoguttula mirabilis]
MPPQDAGNGEGLDRDIEVETTLWNHLKAELLIENVTKQEALESGEPGCGICSCSLDEIEEEKRIFSRLKYCPCQTVYCAEHIRLWMKTTGERGCPTCRLVGGPDHADFPHSTDYISSAAATVIKDGYFGVGDGYARLGWERFDITAIELAADEPDRMQRMAKTVNKAVGYDVDVATLVKKLVSDNVHIERKDPDQKGAVSDAVYLRAMEREAPTLVHMSKVVSNKQLFAEELESGRRYLANWIAQRLKEGHEISRDYDVVEAIVGHEWADDGSDTLYFRTKWLGFSEEWNTLEKETHLYGKTTTTTCAEEAIDAYYVEIGGVPVYQAPVHALN